MKKANKSTNKTFKSVLPKILSVVAALILWFYVADIKTTIEEKVISDVRVNIVNFDKTGDIDIVSGSEHTIEVTVSGVKSEIEKVTSDDIVATIDMSGINEPGVYSPAVYVTSPSGITMKSKTPSEITIRVDKTSSKHIGVALDYNYKDVADDISNIGDAVFSASSIQVTGPKGDIEKIDRLQVSLDFDVISGTIIAKGQYVVPVDANGNEITSPYIKLNQSMVDVTIPVYKTKMVEVVPVFKDELNYTYSYRLHPKEITIEGESSYIDNMTYVKTEPVDVNKFAQNLDLPDGISAYDENNNRIHSVSMSDIIATPITISDDMEQTDAE